MYSKVKRLRKHGSRRPDREIQSAPGTVGHLTMVTIGNTRELKLHAAGDDSQRAPVIPMLFNPEIVSMHGARMLFAGWERKGDQNDPKSQTVLQEWSVEVMVEPPADLVRSSHRPPG